jgi:predicted acyltransferase
MTIAAMILVSAPGSWTAVYAPLDHALWHGWTPTDLVFPFLLFAMGAAVPFAMARRRGARRVVRRHVLRRATVLFTLGLVLNAIEAPAIDWATFRIPGVLQRIAIVYLAVTGMTERLSIRAQVAIVISALAGYWAAMTLIPVPGVGAGVLTPEGNLASFVDRALLGRHLLTPSYDPEGLLSTVPAIATAMAGVFAGAWLTAPPDGVPETGRRTAWMFAAGCVAAIIGLAWGRVFPINKNLWTGSFALLAAGIAAAVMAACHFSVDIGGWRGWSRPFVAFGRNPLAAYFLSVGLDSVLTRWVVGDGAPLKALLYSRLFAATIQPCCGAEAASLAYAVAYVVLWSAVMLEMHRRGVFVGI